MVNAGRVVCITLPFILSIGALACLVLIFIAGTIQKNSTVDNLYFASLDLTNFTLGSSTNIPSQLGLNTTQIADALDAAKQTLGLKDHYAIYLRNYCSWNGNDDYGFCSSPQAYFWFNPIKVWGLNSTGVNIDTLLPQQAQDGLSLYQQASKAMFVLYAGALAASSLTILVGFSAIFSRWGSFFTTFFALAACSLIAGASAVATALAVILTGALNATFEKDYGITTTIGTKSLAVTWIGTAFAITAGFFWLFSVCCCSGRSPYNPGSREARRTRAEKTPYTYERVGSPYMGPRDSQAVPLNTFNTGYTPQPTRDAAYEPFRPHHGV